jgi:hypothetical protein
VNVCIVIGVGLGPFCTASGLSGAFAAPDQSILWGQHKALGAWAGDTVTAGPTQVLLYKRSHVIILFIVL